MPLCDRLWDFASNFYDLPEIQPPILSTPAGLGCTYTWFKSNISLFLSWFHQSKVQTCDFLTEGVSEGQTRGHGVHSVALPRIFGFPQFLCPEKFVFHASHGKF